MATGIKNIKYFTPVPWKDKTTNSERVTDKSFTLLRPFNGQLEIRLLYYFGETIKLGFNRKKHDSSSDLKLKHQIRPMKVFLE